MLLAKTIRLQMRNTEALILKVQNQEQQTKGTQKHNAVFFSIADFSNLFKNNTKYNLKEIPG